MCEHLLKRLSFRRIFLLFLHRDQHSVSSVTANKDYYKILNLPNNASTEDIKNSFISLSKRLHPDVVGDDPDLTSNFIEVNEAFSILGKENLRKEYDFQRKLNAFGLLGSGFRMEYPPPDSTDPNFISKYDVEMHKRWNKRLDEWAIAQGQYELERGIHITPLNHKPFMSYMETEEIRHTQYLILLFLGITLIILYLVYDMRKSQNEVPNKSLEV